MLVPGLPQSAPSTFPSQALAGSSRQQQPPALPCPQALYPAAHRVFPHSDPGRQLCHIADAPRNQRTSRRGISASTSPRHNKLCPRQ